MASTDAGAAGAVEVSECKERFVIVGKGLSLSHKHNTASARVEVASDVSDLVIDLVTLERSRETELAGGAKCTTHSTSSLCAHADRQVTLGWHPHALNSYAVGHLQKILPAAVGRLLSSDLNGHV